jgi:prepilin-type processing-associated H-X9-DG protein
VRGAWALPWSGATLMSMDMHPANPAGTENCAPYACQIIAQLHSESPNRTLLPAYAPWVGSVGYSQPPNGRLPDVLYECPDSADAQLERMPCYEFAKVSYMSAAPRSNHLGGVNAAYLDGHVEFLPDDIDEMTMALLISTNDSGPAIVYGSNEE